MTDREKRAHDLAVSLLPHIIKENNQTYYSFDENGNGTFNAPEITDEYWSVYEALLRQLPDQGEL